MLYIAILCVCFIYYSPVTIFVISSILLTGGTSVLNCVMLKMAFHVLQVH